MDYVLDSSIALKWHFKEKFSEEARWLLPRLISGTDRAFAPELLQAEFAHVLRTRRFQHQMSIEDVWDAWAAFLLVPIEYVPIGRVMVDAFALANEKMISSYDAVYVRLAINLDSPLLTTDVNPPPRRGTEGTKRGRGLPRQLGLRKVSPALRQRAR